MMLTKYATIILSFLGTINFTFAADPDHRIDSPRKELRTIGQVIKEEEEIRKRVIPEGFKKSHKISHTDLTAILAGSIGYLKSARVYEKAVPTKDTIYKYYSPTLQQITDIEVSDNISFKYSNIPCTSNGTKIVTLCYFFITSKTEKGIGNPKSVKNLAPLKAQEDKKDQIKHAFMIMYYSKKDWINLSETERQELQFAVQDIIAGWGLLYGKKTTSALADPLKSKTTAASPSISQDKHSRRRSQSIGTLDVSQLLALQGNASPSNAQLSVASKSELDLPEVESPLSTNNLPSETKNRVGPPSLQTIGKGKSAFFASRVIGDPSKTATSSKMLPSIPFSTTTIQEASSKVDAPISPRTKIRTHATRQRSGSFNGVFTGTTPATLKKELDEKLKERQQLASSSSTIRLNKDGSS